MTQMPNSPQESTGSATGERPGELIERFLARLVDGLLLVVVYGIVAAILRGDGYLYDLIMAVMFAALSLGYYAYLDSTQGQTVGKMALKLEVRAPSGGHPSMEESVRRNVLYLVGLLTVIPLIGWVVGTLAQLIGAIMIAVGISSDTERRQAWHDKFAGGTYVVKRPA